MADPLWIRSERPDGHRSLWVHVDRWYLMWYVEPFFPIAADGLTRVAPTESEMAARCGAIHVPVPTPEDLAWLRGVG